MPRSGPDLRAARGSDSSNDTRRRTRERAGARGPDPRLLCGYVFFDRAFAWIHVPGTPLFLGELVIVIGVVVLLGMHTQSGIVRTSWCDEGDASLHGMGRDPARIGALPTWGEDAIRDAAVWYYGIIAVFVIVLLISDPRRISSWLRLFGRIIPWMLVWFPIAIVLDAAFIDRFPMIPDSNIPIVSHRTGNIAVMAAAGTWLSLARRPRQRSLQPSSAAGVLTMLATVVILFAAMRNRGGFLAAGLALSSRSCFSAASGRAWPGSWSVLRRASGGGPVRERSS